MHIANTNLAVLSADLDRARARYAALARGEATLFAFHQRTAPARARIADLRDGAERSRENARLHPGGTPLRAAAFARARRCEELVRELEAVLEAAAPPAPTADEIEAASAGLALVEDAIECHADALEAELRAEIAKGNLAANDTADGANA